MRPRTDELDPAGGGRARRSSRAGIDDVWDAIEEFAAATAGAEQDARRRDQAGAWMRDELADSLLDRLHADRATVAAATALEADVAAGRIAPTTAARVGCSTCSSTAADLPLRRVSVASCRPSVTSSSPSDVEPIRSSTCSTGSTPIAAETRLAPRRWFVWAGLEALLAFALAMFRIDARSIWYDEAVSVLASGSSLTEVEHVARTFDPNMSGYHAILNLWQRAFGDSETGLRSLSAVAIAAAVFVIVSLGRSLHDERTGLIAGLVLAVSPFFVRYGQEARSYALEVLVVTTATYLFVRVVDDDIAGGRAWPALPYGAVAAFACYVHLYSVFVLVAHAVSLAFVDPARVPWQRLRRSATLFAPLILPMLIWLALGPSERIQWISRPSPHDLYVVARDIFGGGVVAGVLGVLVLVTAVQCSESFARVRRSRAVWADGLAILWLATPFVLSVLISFTIKPIFLDRYLIVCIPAVALLAATALARLRVRIVATCVLTVIVTGSLAAVDRNYGGHRTDWRDAITYFTAYATTNDGVVVCPARARLPVTYYVTRTIRPELRPIPLSPSDPWDAGFRVKGVSKFAAAEWIKRGPERIWVLGKSQRCEFTFPGREHNVSMQFIGMAVERFDRPVR